MLVFNDFLYKLIFHSWQGELLIKYLLKSLSLLEMLNQLWSTKAVEVVSYQANVFLSCFIHITHLLDMTRSAVYCQIFFALRGLCLCKTFCGTLCSLSTLTHQKKKFACKKWKLYHGFFGWLLSKHFWWPLHDEYVSCTPNNQWCLLLWNCLPSNLTQMLSFNNNTSDNSLYNFLAKRFHVIYYFFLRWSKIVWKKWSL